MRGKALGALFLVGCAVTVAQHLIKRERSALAALDAWIALLGEIRTQIDCFLLPIDEILQNTRLECFQAFLQGKKPISLAQALHATSPWLDAESQRILSDFVASFGGSYSEEQIKRCDLGLSALQKHRERISLELPKRKKLYLALSSCASVGLAILLW